MRVVPLRTVQAENGEQFEYRTAFIEVLRVTPQGMTIPEMEQALGIIAQVKSANGVLALEDSDWVFLKGRLNAARWSVAEPALVEMVKTVNDAPSKTATELLAGE